ncbi:unnamed protein product [Hermetia illucens]|uniref:Uncharacterized protein n=1 Tax=Hermetia illucens TaxID=343691 RepID=A0A7R8YVT0_HERIL|nr:unnamed protein product [Hermetia illucens]
MEFNYEQYLKIKEYKKRFTYIAYEQPDEPHLEECHYDRLVPEQDVYPPKMLLTDDLRDTLEDVRLQTSVVPQGPTFSDVYYFDDTEHEELYNDDEEEDHLIWRAFNEIEMDDLEN